MMDVEQYSLHYSESFRDATDAERAVICNGAGAANGLKFPNTFYGLNVRIAFDVHDWDYCFGKTLADKDRADKYMLLNMMTIIEAQKGIVHAVLKPLRRRRALKYYEMVVTFGNDAFFAGKE